MHLPPELRARANAFRTKETHIFMLGQKVPRGRNMMVPTDAIIRSCVECYDVISGDSLPEDRVDPTPSSPALVQPSNSSAARRTPIDHAELVSSVSWPCRTCVCGVVGAGSRDMDRRREGYDGRLVTRQSPRCILGGGAYLGVVQSIASCEHSPIGCWLLVSLQMASLGSAVVFTESSAHRF